MPDNKFFGIKVSKPNVNVNQANDNQLIFKNDFTTQTFYTDTGTLSFGTVSNNQLGMQLTDSNGFISFVMNGSTWSWYDANTGKNIMQIGLLPDGTYGMAIAKYNIDVGSAFS